MKLSPYKIIAIIPAFNEEKSISTVVKKLSSLYPYIDILVINDGSTDQTSYYAEKFGANVITLPYNLGIGGAVQTGYLYARNHEYDIAIQIDADGQHKPDELYKILQPLLNDEADLIVGSRFIEKTSYRSSLSRRIGIAVLSILVGFIARQHITDATSGFRIVNKKGIRLFARDYATDYPEVDSLVLVKKHGLRIKEVPVEMEQRLHGSSSITAIRSVYYMIKVSVTLLMRAIRTYEGTGST
jgi:hypothetical protein